MFWQNYYHPPGFVYHQHTPCIIFCRWKYMSSVTACIMWYDYSLVFVAFVISIFDFVEKLIERYVLFIKWSALVLCKYCIGLLFSFVTATSPLKLTFCMISEQIYNVKSLSRTMHSCLVIIFAELHLFNNLRIKCVTSVGSPISSFVLYKCDMMSMY